MNKNIDKGFKPKPPIKPTGRLNEGFKPKTK